MTQPHTLLEVVDATPWHGDALGHVLGCQFYLGQDQAPSTPEFPMSVTWML